MSTESSDSQIKSSSSLDRSSGLFFLGSLFVFSTGLEYVLVDLDEAQDKTAFGSLVRLVSGFETPLKLSPKQPADQQSTASSEVRPGGLLSDEMSGLDSGLVLHLTAGCTSTSSCVYLLGKSHAGRGEKPGGGRIAAE